MEERNELRRSNQIIQIILAVITIFSLLFGGGFYVLGRVSDVEKTVAIESERRQNIEKTVSRIEEKLDTLIEKIK